MYHNGHDALAFFQGILTGQEQLKNAILLALHGMGIAVPATEITGQIHPFGGRCPLTVDPATIDLMEAIIQMAIGEICQRTFRTHQGCLLVLVIAHAHFDIALKGLQIRIQLCDL